MLYIKSHDVGCVRCGVLYIKSHEMGCYNILSHMTWGVLYIKSHEMGCYKLSHMRWVCYI